MKKTLLISAIALGALSASAQAIESPAITDNWSLGIQGGVTTPLKHHAFFGSMKPVIGITLDKQITPIFAAGVEGQFAIGTSDWKGRTYSATAFDDSYVGAYGAVDLINLFGGYPGYMRPFSLEAQAGAGWGHMYLNKAAGSDHNYFATKVGLNFNFNVSNSVTINVSPSVYWDMTDNHVSQTSAAYDANKATFNLQAGIVWHMGGQQFTTVKPYDQAEVDALNGQINDLRGQLQGMNAELKDAQLQANMLANELEICRNKPAEVIHETETNNFLSTVRYVYYKIGSAQITGDQKPNVEMIAIYLKNHPTSKVVIKGYASKDGNLENNIRLAQRRAQGVKDMLVNTYKIAPDRITAEGEGIGNMFQEESWNRVSICTIETEEHE